MDYVVTVSSYLILFCSLSVFEMYTDGHLSTK